MSEKALAMEYDLVALAFGHVLTTLREERHLSEDDFARIAGLEPSYYRELESAACAPTLYCLLRLAAGIGWEPEQLVTATCERLAHLDRAKRAADEAWKAHLNPKAQSGSPAS